MGWLRGGAGYPASIRVPEGWTCDAGGSAMMGDEFLETLSCLPKEGGSPVSLQRMFKVQQPDSLKAYLHRSIDDYRQVDAKNVLVRPRMISLADRKAVEHASKAIAIADHVGGGASHVELATHTIVFEDRSVFYLCELTASPVYMTEMLSRIHIDLCSSIRFDGTANLSGKQ